MTQPEIDAAKPIGRPRIHRMMRQSEAVRRMREYRKTAGETELQAGMIRWWAFWRWAEKRVLTDRAAHYRELARIYAEVAGVTA
jgi:hypothetical protein